MYILVLDAELDGKLFSSNVLPTKVKVSNSGLCPFTAALTILDFIYVVSTCTVTYTFRQVSHDKLVNLCGWSGRQKYF